MDEKQARIQALSDITSLMQACKSQLADKTNVYQKGGAIATSEINIQPTSKSIQLSAYEKVIQETNLSLQGQNFPFTVSLEVKDGQHFLAVGYFQKEDSTFFPQAELEIKEKIPLAQEQRETTAAPFLSLNNDTQLQLKSYVGEILQKQGKEQEGKAYVQRVGAAIISFFHNNVQGVNEVGRIKAPQELANEMIAYNEGKSKTMPTAKCVDISLLTNEMLKLYGFESAVLSLHAIDEFGDEQKGHATSAVAEGGWMVDPALKNFAFQIKGFTIDKENKNYNGFSTRMNSEYLSELQKLTDAEHPLHNIEFHLDKKENELQAMFLVENGSIMRNKGDYGGAAKLFKQAYELNSHNFYAARYYASSIRNSNPAEAARLYKECADYNPSLYLANYFATVGLSNISVKDEKGETHPFMEDAHKYGLESVKRGGDYFYPNYQMNRIAKFLNRDEEAEFYADKLKLCAQPPESK